MLGTHQLGETDLIVTLLTARGGTVRGVARAARRSRKRFGGALEPMTRVAAEWSERSGRDLHRIDALEPRRSFAAMQAEPARQAACAVLCEIAGAMVREGESDNAMFRLLAAVLESMEQGLPPEVAVRYFELWTLKLHGLLPEIGRCNGCGSALAERCWVSSEQGLVCPACARSEGRSARLLHAAERAFLVDAIRRPPAELAEHRAATRAGGALELLLRGTLQAFVERGFRSYRHLEAALRVVPPAGAADDRAADDTPPAEETS